MGDILRLLMIYWCCRYWDYWWDLIIDGELSIIDEDLSVEALNQVEKDIAKHYVKNIDVVPSSMSLPIYQNHLTSKIKTTYRPKINFTVETKNYFCLDWNNGSTKNFVWMFMMTKEIISDKNCCFALRRESTNWVWKINERTIGGFDSNQYRSSYL